MNTSRRSIYIAIIGAIVCWFAIDARRLPPGSNRSEKARYYYVEGTAALAEDRNTEAYEFFRKANAIDPNYPEAAYAYASMRISMRNDTLRSATEYAKSMDMMRTFVDRYPGETNEAMQYSYLAARGGDLDEAIRVAKRTDSIAPSITATLLQLSTYYAARQDMPNAIECLDRFERIEGANPQLTMRKLSLMFNLGDTAALINEADRLVRENPVSPDYLVLRGNVYEALDRPQDAYADYLRAEALDPDDGNTKLTLANYFLQMGDSASYDTKSQEALLSENLELEEKLDMLTHYLQALLSDSADTRRGDRLFEGLLAQYPHEAKVLDLGAQYSSATGDLAKAQEQMAYATDLEPENPDYWSRLMAYYFADDKYRDVTEAFKKAELKLPEVTTTMLTIYAASASNADMHSEAHDAYQRMLGMVVPGAVLTEPSDSLLRKCASLGYDELMKASDIIGMAADASYKAGNTEEAMTEYENCIVLNPDNMMALNNYAYHLALNGGDLEKAERLSRRVVEDQPDNPTYIDTLAWILYLRGEYADALLMMDDAIGKATEQNALSGEYFDHIGDIQFHLGEKAEALESWRKALELDKDNASLAAKIRRKAP